MSGTIRRRELLALSGAWLCGCGGDPSAPRKVRADPLEQLSPDGIAPSELRVGIPPSSGADTHRRLAPLFDYLSAELGRAVVGVTTSAYDQLAVKMRSRALEVGVFSPAAYALARGDLDAVALATGTRNGSPTYLGYLVVHEDRRPTLAELQGRRVAWVEIESTSGYLYPRAMLRKKGHDPTRFFSAELFAGNHQSALEMVLSGDVDVAAAASPFVDRGTATSVAGAERLTVVAKTARIPRDCIVVQRGLQRELAMKLREALLGLSRHPHVASLLEGSWGLDGFVPPLHRLYDEVAELVTTG